MEMGENPQSDPVAPSPPAVAATVPRPHSKGKGHKPVNVRPPPFSVAQRLRDEFGIRRVIVAMSGGKDSVAALSVCRDYFADVRAFFMYLVPDLGFQERYLSYIERRFALPPILRVPNAPLLAQFFRSPRFRHPTEASVKAPRIKYREVYAYVRQKINEQAGIGQAGGGLGGDEPFAWIATGERAVESVQRNAMIRQCKAISETRQVFFPLGYWNASMVFSRLKTERVALAPEYGVLGHSHSFGSLFEVEIEAVRRTWPEDYAKILRQFPLLAAYKTRRETSTQEAE